MRTKQLLQAVQGIGSDIQTLLTYLALTEEHFGTYAIVDPFGKVLLENKINMTDKGEIIKMKLIPAKSGGIVFRMLNMPEDKNEILLDYRNTFDLTRGTNLKNEHGAMVFTVEHFLSALYVAGITDLIVELNGNELPICDGSAIKFLDLFQESGIAELDEDVEFDISANEDVTGHLTYRSLKSTDKEQLLLNAMLVALKTIEENYSDYITIEVREVK